MCRGSGGKAPGPKLEAPSGFEPEMEVLQTSALPLGDGADQTWAGELVGPPSHSRFGGQPSLACQPKLLQGAKVGAGNGIRTRDFDLGKVALYH